MTGMARIDLTVRFVDLDAQICSTAHKKTEDRHTRRRSVLHDICRELQDDLIRRRGGGAMTRAIDPGGKPRLWCDGVVSSTGLSLAHSDGLGLVVLAEDAEVGADLEVLRPVIDRTVLSRRLFSRSEQGWLAGLAESGRDDGFLRLWTLKEAYLKATGEGLARDPASVSIGWDDDGRPNLVAVGDDATLAEGWTLRMLDAPPNHIAAVAVKTGTARLSSSHLRGSFPKPLGSDHLP